jgi:myo-inositol-1(or 4)-monophosphatase
MDPHLPRAWPARGRHPSLRRGFADLAWVAAGRYDGFWESSLQPWDSAAGCLLVREAGGFVSDYKGRSLPICDETVLAGNDALHSKLHKLVAGALKAR